MRKYTKFIVVAGSLAALAGPSVAMADGPSGYAANPNAPASSVPTADQFQGSPVGYYSSKYIHNGSPNNTASAPSVSQQAQAGDRSANVQALLGH